MEDSKTKYIESSLAAFRAIKTFVFIKGIYPRIPCVYQVYKRKTTSKVSTQKELYGLDCEPVGRRMNS